MPTIGVTSRFGVGPNTSAQPETLVPVLVVVDPTGTPTGEFRANSHSIVELPASARTSGTLSSDDAGTMVEATGNITVAAKDVLGQDIFRKGNAVSIWNTTTADITLIEDPSVTTYLSGTASTGNRTLAQKGIATIWFSSSVLGVWIGQGLT